MTEQEFTHQVWRIYDKITTAEGIKGKVLGVSFTTKSVRAHISGAPEWIPCELIETHTTAKGGSTDDVTIIEELHDRVLGLNARIDKLTEEKNRLQEALSKNNTGAILTQCNIIASNLQEKKKRIERIEAAIQAVTEAVETIKTDI